MSKLSQAQREAMMAQLGLNTPKSKVVTVHDQARIDAAIAKRARKAEALAKKVK